MNAPSRTLGTLLRHLIELLDGAVEQTYVDAGLDYRPRFTPVVRSLMTLGPASIKDLAGHAGLTHSAASQTVARMARAGLVELQRGTDQRQHMVALTDTATAMIPRLERIWQAVNQAAGDLDAELGLPLSQVAGDAISALERQDFAHRIRAAAERLAAKSEAQ